MDLRPCAWPSKPTLKARSATSTEALTTKQGTPVVRARTMVTLCRAMGIPARLVTGFEIEQADNTPAAVWVEVFYNQRWVPFDTENGYSQTLPSDYVPVRRGGDPIVDPIAANVSGRDGDAIRFSRLPSRPARLRRPKIKHPLQIFNLEAAAGADAHRDVDPAAAAVCRADHGRDAQRRRPADVRHVLARRCWR